MTFKELGLIPQLLRAVENAGYRMPTPIQQKTIPPLLRGRDVLGLAQTGTGKTAAFSLPILQQLAGNPLQKGAPRVIRALILTPTRELAIQIDENIRAYGRYLPIKNAVIYGGVSQNPQVRDLRSGVDILTATPGRLLDLIGQGHVMLRQVEIFVLDEADRMLDMGFIPDIRRILEHVPQKRQTMLFSATMPDEIAAIVKEKMSNPVRIEAAPAATTVETIDQRVFFVDKENKTRLLNHLLADQSFWTVLVFTRTKHGADRVARALKKAGHTATAIHGNKSQNARQRALSDFKDHKVRVLVATDIAARGIDVEDISHVVNYDMPDVAETYVHRIGRTGRAGQSGTAVSFCSAQEKSGLEEVEKLIGIRIPVVGDHPYPMQKLIPEPKPAKGRPASRGASRRGSRSSGKPAGSGIPAKAQASQQSGKAPGASLPQRTNSPQMPASEPKQAKSTTSRGRGRRSSPPRLPVLKEQDGHEIKTRRCWSNLRDK